MKKKATNSNLPKLNTEINGKNYFHGYAPYHVEKGTQTKYHDDTSLKNHDATKKKKLQDAQDERIGRDFNHDFHDSDICESELDDSQEEIENEDDESQFS
jgi:hypothetical protein